MERASIISGQGALFRGSKEEEVRKKMILGDIENNLQGDIIEGIVELPKSLFYGTSVPGCIFILNKNKSTERKNKIIFIHAAKKGHFADLPARNKLRKQDIEKIVSAIKNFKEEYGFSHVANLEEIEENEFNLNVARYVDISTYEKPENTSKIIEEINVLSTDIVDLKNRVNCDLEELEMDVIS